MKIAKIKIIIKKKSQSIYIVAIIFITSMVTYTKKNAQKHGSSGPVSDK